MKLKFTTALYIAVNAIILIFRTLQIILLTEPETAFLKDDYVVINVIGAAISFLALLLLGYNSYRAIKQPVGIKISGVSTLISATICGVSLIISCSFQMIYKSPAWKMTLVLGLLAALCVILMAATSVTTFKFKKIFMLPIIVFWAYQFVMSYVFYTGRPLRVRTIYEIFAMCLVILFFICMGKAYSNVNTKKNLQRLYPLGLMASSLCFISVVPEFIAEILGYSTNVSVSAVSITALFGSGVLIATVALNTFKRSNTI